MAAERAVSVIGLGYDLTSDIRLTACKPGPNGSGLIEVDQKSTKDLVVPGGVVVSNVSTSIKCDKGERTRFRSDALSFSQVKFLVSVFSFQILFTGKFCLHPPLPDPTCGILLAMLLLLLLVFIFPQVFNMGMLGKWELGNCGFFSKDFVAAAVHLLKRNTKMIEKSL